MDVKFIYNIFGWSKAVLKVEYLFSGFISHEKKPLFCLIWSYFKLLLSIISLIFYWMDVFSSNLTDIFWICSIKFLYYSFSSETSSNYNNSAIISGSLLPTTLFIYCFTFYEIFYFYVGEEWPFITNLVIALAKILEPFFYSWPLMAWQNFIREKLLDGYLIKIRESRYRYS